MPPYFKNLTKFLCTKENLHIVYRDRVISLSTVWFRQTQAFHATSSFAKFDHKVLLEATSAQTIVNSSEFYAVYFGKTSINRNEQNRYHANADNCFRFRNYDSINKFYKQVNFMTQLDYKWNIWWKQYHKSPKLFVN